MGGTWRHGTTYYLCRYRDGNAAPEGHPNYAYVREDAVLPKLDRWLAQVFDADNIDATLDALVAAAAQGDSDADRAAELAITTAAAVIDKCDEELVKYRAALDAGADPAVVTKWIADSQSRRVAAQHQMLTARASRRPRITRDQLSALLDTLGDAVAAIETSDPDDKAVVYATLGLTVTYNPLAQTLIAECDIDTAAWGKRSCRRGELTLTYTRVALPLGG